MNQPILMQVMLTLIAAMTVLRIISRVRARTVGVFFAGTWLTGIFFFLIFVWMPALATRVSQFLGVGRGVDAALYVGVALLFYLNLRLLLRLEKQEHLITTLVSELALLRHEQEKK